jgi:CBS domain containing-hemolysin-like protein
MDSDSIYRCLTLIALIVAGGLLTGIETAYSSCNKVRLKNDSDNGDKKSKQVLKILDNSDKAINTILILINIIHVCAAAAATVIAVKLLGDWGTAVAIIVTTLLVFTFCEIIPKLAAKENADNIVLKTSSVMKFLIFILYPVVFIFNSLGKLVRIITGRDNKAPSMTEDELQSMIETIEEEGVLESDESELIQSAIDFLDTTADDILTPRVDVIAIDIDWRKEKIDSTIIKEKYSRLPVYENTIDNIIGILQSRKYLKSILSGQEVDIREIMDKPVFIHESMLVNKLFEMMSANRTHMVIVTDDYGGTAGIVTMEDIMEELVGDIFDEDDIYEEDHNYTPEGILEIDGDMRMDDLFDILDKAYTDDIIEHKTVSAWTMEHLQNVPAVGDSFDSMGLHLTIKELDGMRIEKLTVETIEDKNGTDENKEEKEGKA